MTEKEYLTQNKILELIVHHYNEITSLEALEETSNNLIGVIENLRNLNRAAFKQRELANGEENE